MLGSLRDSSLRSAGFWIHVWDRCTVLDGSCFVFRAFLWIFSTASTRRDGKPVLLFGLGFLLPFFPLATGVPAGGLWVMI